MANRKMVNTMRLIDADKFPTEHVNVGYDDYEIGFDEGIQIMLDEIKDAPTVDAMPIVRGHWVKDITYDLKQVIKCSVCKQKNNEFSNYCPSCGAKMNEEHE